MKDFLKTNGKQILVMALSLAAAVLIYKKPELRAYVLMAGVALGSVGIHLDPVTYGGGSLPPSGDK